MSFSYHAFVGLCRPYFLPAPWDALTTKSVGWLGPADPAAALQILLEQYPAEVLAAGGLAAAGDDGQLRLHRYLSQPNTLLLGLQKWDSRGFRCLLTSAGCVGSEDLPFTAVMRDRLTRELLKLTASQLFLAENLETALLLRAAGLAAAPIGAMAGLGHAGCAQLKKIFEIECMSSPRDRDLLERIDLISAANAGPTPAQRAGGGSVPSDDAEVKDDADENDETADMVLVGFSPLDMTREIPAGVSAVLARLHDLAKYQRLDRSGIRIWQPSAEGLGRIAFALTERDPDWITGAVHDSQLNEQRGLTQTQSSAATAAERLDLVAAAEGLYTILQNRTGDDASRRKLKEAGARYRRIATVELVNPLLREAQLSSNPIRRLQTAQLAELTRLFLTKWPSVLAEESIERAEGDARGGSESKTVTEILAISQQMVAITKELSKCQRYPRTLKEKSRPFTIDASPCGHLGFEAKS